jgi:hypothetical protein
MASPIPGETDMADQTTVERTAKDPASPINRSELAVMLAYEAASLTESQASALLGHGNDVVGFRIRREYVLAEVAKFSKRGGLPNLAVERPRPLPYHLSSNGD